MILYCPLPSVTTLRTFSINAGLAASTVTPGSTAPDESRTTPSMDACANEIAGTAAIRTTATSNALRMPIFTLLLSAPGRPLNRRVWVQPRQLPQQCHGLRPRRVRLDGFVERRSGRDVQWRLVVHRLLPHPGLGLQVEPGALADQQPDDLVGATGRRAVEGGGALVVHRVDVEAALEQQVHRRERHLLGGESLRHRPAHRVVAPPQARRRVQRID